MDPLDPETIAKCLSKATGREWIAIAKTKDEQIVLLEQRPNAHMSYCCSTSGESTIWEWEAWSFNCDEETGADLSFNWDWEHSLVRDYLNGPYLATLPQWAVDRLVTIEVIDGEKKLYDNATLLSEAEIDLFLADVPSDLHAIAALRSYKQIVNAREQAAQVHECYDDDAEYENYDSALDDDYVREDPLTRWENDPRQYSKEGYDEWMNDHDSVLEAQKDWEWARSLEDEADYNEYLREQKKLEEQRQARWRTTLCNAGLEWTREGHESHAFRSNYLYELGTTAAIRPVICLNSGKRNASDSGCAVVLSDAMPLLAKLSEAELDTLVALLEEYGDVASQRMAKDRKREEESVEHPDEGHSEVIAEEDAPFEEDIPF